MVANRIVPHLPWLVLIAMASFFYKTRIFADSGFYVAQVINTQNFYIECLRIVAVIPQIVPLLGIWTGIEIKLILLLFSLSHVVFFYLLFLFVYYGLRDRRSGLLIILTQTVGIIYGFFAPMFELYYGVALLITFYAIWRKPFRFRAIYVMLLLEALILLSHPAAFILFAYVLLYDFTKKTVKSYKFYVPVILVYAATLLLRYFVKCNYMPGMIAGILSNNVPDLINPINFKALGIFMLRYYTEVLLAFLLVIFMLVNQKQWFRLFLFSSTFLLYLLLANSVFQVTQVHYIEQILFPLVPLVFIPLIYGFPTVGKQGLLNISILLVAALIAFRLTIIYFGSEKFVKRVAQMEQLIHVARQKGGNKFVVSEQAVNHGYTLLTPSYPVETLLLSAIDGNDISATIASQQELRSNKTIHADQFIFRAGELKQQNWLNKRYFHLDIGQYRTLNDSTPNAAINITAGNLRITIDSKNIYSAMDTVWIPVSIINQGKTPIYSGIQNHVFLSYFWVVNKDVLNWNEIKTPLQADIKGSLRQDIKVAIPRNKGRMQLKVDIIADGDWLGIYSQEDVMVY